MADTKGAVNRVWMSVDTGSTNYGPKVSFFAGGDTPDEVIGHFAAAFGQAAADQGIERLFTVLTTDQMAAATSNVQSGGMVGNNSAQSDPSAPLCNHGARNRVSGNGAKGPWQAWMCPLPKGASGKCDPVWIK